MEVLVLAVAGRRFALPLADVREVVRAVAVRPLPRAPAAVTGVVDVRGELAPVLDPRPAFGLPPREVDPAEVFAVARAGGRLVVLRADSAEGVEAVDDAPDGEALRRGGVAGVARLADGSTLLVHDLAAFLDAAEAAALDGALVALAEAP